MPRNEIFVDNSVKVKQYEVYLYMTEQRFSYWARNSWNTVQNYIKSKCISSIYYLFRSASLHLKLENP